MSGAGAVHGVQVLFVEGDGSYRVDEAALRRVAAHESVRGLPVAVVSVAGATRGGKSFLLDFFLRYLRASEEDRSSGDWLGADDEPLIGFSWRGGWERNTTGILLWSEPIIVTQQVNGKSRKLAVLLMDTQGTFDHASTVKDCTTIFAMSTLLSSVQIYNLSQIIKEDDLQHLQLFTEYGRLARAQEESKPFQALTFRVRDWMCPYEHPYGAAGGERYLRTILAAGSQNAEIRELRDHIRSCFESVSCFLTPHPGMAVADQNFSGRLCDLLPEFKMSISEFVPLMLHPSKLIPKIINGQEVKAEELLTYFRTYVDIFNSDELPTPVTILEATSSACLETAVSASREEYVSHMERSTSGATSVPRAALPRLHAAALAATRDAFAARRTLAAPDRAAARLDALLVELDALLPNYVAINHGKILKAVSDARAAYEAEVNAACGDDRPLCLHPLDAPLLHTAASAAAMQIFTASRQPHEGDDPDRNDMLRWLDSKGQQLQASNELNNVAARVSAGALYAEHVQRATSGGALAAERLRREHDAARAAAIDALRAARNRPTDQSDEDDCFLVDLIRNIEEQFQRWESSNSHSTRTAMRAAVAGYNSRMSAVWGPHACLHPRAFRREHDSALHAARAELRLDTSADGGSEEEHQLVQLLEDRYSELRQMNEASNESLVAAAYAEYCRRMDVKCAPSLTSILIIPWVLKVLVQLPKYHERACREALDYFRSRRRCFGDEEDDEYIDALKDKLNGGYEVYCNPVHALATELNIPTPST